MLSLTKWAMGENMSARQYLFGFSGRINRAKIWLWVLIVIATFIVAAAIAYFGFDWTATRAALHAHVANTPVDWSTIPKPGCKGWVSIVAMVVLALIVVAYAWAKLAVYAKRLHDRARSGWWLLLYLGAPAILHGYACHTMGVGCHGGKLPQMLHAMTLPGKIAWAVAVLISLWVFIDLYCLKGTKGANKYGADPLDPNWCDPEKPVKGCTPRPMKLDL